MFATILPSFEINTTPLLELDNKNTITFQDLAKEQNLLKKEIKELKRRIDKMEKNARPGEQT